MNRVSPKAKCKAVALSWVHTFMKQYCVESAALTMVQYEHSVGYSSVAALN